MTLQHVLDDAVESEDAPFLVGMTANAAGVTWSGSSGYAAPGRPAATDTVFRIFSMTKAVGSTACDDPHRSGRVGLRHTG